MTTQTEHSPLFSEETLAAYADGRLDEATRKRVVEHIADCPECFEIVQVIREMSAATPAAQVIQWPRNLMFTLAAAAAVGAVVMLTPVREMVWPHDDLGALAKVAPPKRVFDGRLTGFPFRVRAATYRGSDDTNDDLESYKFLQVASNVEKRATEHPDARTLHAEGVLQLSLGHPADAVKTLEQAQQRSAKSGPQLLSDLSAAYVAVGEYKKAVDAADHAWAMAKTPEIAWNRAIALQRAERYNEAILAWNDYLKINDSPEWEPEAQRHLRDAQEALQNPPK